ncbi:MAG: PleD family two-component system response regulator [Mariniblastus sp.]
MKNNSTSLNISKSVACVFEKKIFIVDDVDLVCRTVSAQLKSAGFANVSYESDSRNVMASLEVNKPHMILLDIFMPHICGLDILQAIRANPDYDDVIVLMLSSAGSEERFNSIELGAFGFIQKPLTAENLVQTMTSKFAMAARLGIQ